MIWLLFSALLVWSVIFLVIDRKMNVLADSKDGISENKVSLSIVVCMRNESENIVACLDSIDRQNWLPAITQIFIVDDNSTDDSLAKALGYIPDNFNLKVLPLTQGEGKKVALAYALSKVHSEFIYFTDADCQLRPSTIVQLYSTLSQNKAMAVAGAVCFRHDNILTKWVAAENLNNQCVTEAFIHYGIPIMANGANLLISDQVRDVYVESLNSPSASGDDVFFAQRLGKELYVSMNFESSVVTNSEKGVSRFIQQRLRWASKTSKYHSRLAQFFAAVVFLVNALFVLSLIALPFVNGVFWVFLIFLLKSIIEFGFHKKWFYKYRFNHDPITAIVLSITYPFYVVIVGVLAILKVPYNWKDRVWKV